MSLAVSGVGLVSALGHTPQDHVFFRRAAAVRPRASPYRTAEGEPLHIHYAPWLGARLSLAPRLIHLAAAAATEAIAPLGDGPARRGVSLFVCTASPRSGLTADMRDGVERALAADLAPADIVRFSGAAGVFAALVEAAARIEKGRAAAILIVAVDSFIDLASLTARVARPASPWLQVPLSPGEGAAALLVTAPRAGAAHYGEILGAACAAGASTDDDDEHPDGDAMTRVLRALPGASPVRAVYGQLHTDELRRDEWTVALARCAPSFDESHELVTLEESTGETGAAAGAMALAFGLAAAAHGATRDADAIRAPLLAWAISRDGTRGAAVARFA